jgi:hypothetical protein
MICVLRNKGRIRLHRSRRNHNVRVGNQIARLSKATPQTTGPNNSRATDFHPCEGVQETQGFPDPVIGEALEVFHRDNRGDFHPLRTVAAQKPVRHPLPLVAPLLLQINQETGVKMHPGSPSGTGKCADDLHLPHMPIPNTSEHHRMARPQNPPTPRAPLLPCAEMPEKPPAEPPRKKIPDPRFSPGATSRRHPTPKKWFLLPCTKSCMKRLVVSTSWQNLLGRIFEGCKRFSQSRRDVAIHLGCARKWRSWWIATSRRDEVFRAAMPPPPPGFALFGDAPNFPRDSYRARPSFKASPISMRSFGTMRGSLKLWKERIIPLRSTTTAT